MDYDLRVFRENVYAATQSFLGTYTHEGGQVTPAIFVKDGNNSPDPSIRVQGLEVVIKKDPADIEVYKQYGKKFLRATYNIFLVAWGSGDPIAAGFELLNFFTDAIIIPIEVPEGIGPTKQVLVRVSQDIMSTTDNPLRRPLPA